jgi:hypothetical protein
MQPPAGQQLMSVCLVIMRPSLPTIACCVWCRGARLALDVARGVAFLHQLSIVHMDIKPGVSHRSSQQCSSQMQCSFSCKAVK